MFPPQGPVLSSDPNEAGQNAPRLQENPLSAIRHHYKRTDNQDGIMGSEGEEKEQQRVSRLLTTQQVADLTGLKVSRIQSLIRAGEGPPTVRIDRYLRIPADGLARWIERRTLPQ